MMTFPHGRLDNFILLDYVNYLIKRNSYMTINGVGNDRSYVGMLIIPYVIK